MCDIMYQGTYMLIFKALTALNNVLENKRIIGSFYSFPQKYMFK